MDKFKDKYRIPPARAQWWDYGWDASYFITICTRRRKHYFGKVFDKEMLLSDLGKIANDHWLKIINHAKNVELGPHVVMPNHVHGIVNLVGNASAFKFVPSPEFECALVIEDGAFPKTIGQMRMRNPGKNSISTIIGGFKSAVSKEAAEKGFYFGWQGRFHDHIIRDAEEYERISNYILNNPANWKADKFYSPL